MTSIQMHEYAAKLLLLPRELRDMIYPHIVREATPIILASSPDSLIPERDRVKQATSGLHPIACAESSHPIIAAEALEAYWQCNVFALDLHPTCMIENTWIHGGAPKSQIRHLVVFVEEEPSAIFSTQSSSYGSADHLALFERTHWDVPKRQKWNELLAFPKLESLTINMVKVLNTNFDWLFPGPILMELRSQNPSIQISFNISFDEILEEAWNQPGWAPAIVPYGVAASSIPDRYQPMGYIDVSDVFLPATPEDKQYVAEYLPGKRMPTGRHVTRGLLSEPPAQRRLLGHLYFIKEPALLKVLMEEHWMMYKSCERERALVGA